ncbi:MAG: cation transporter [Clostridia bacterium]|nr:cation transporter [Clostridia bacterium]
MKKVFKMLDLDCANCAAKMENEIRKIDGVTDVNISFLAQKMTLEADDARFDEIAKQAAKVCKRVDDDCEVVLK